MSQRLPERPNLDHLRKQARALLEEHREGSAEACKRIRRHPRYQYKNVSVEELRAARFVLRDAQTVLAREYRHKTWGDLVTKVTEVHGLELEPIQRAILNDDIADLRRMIQESRGVPKHSYRWLHSGNEIVTTPLLEFALECGTDESLSVLIDAGADPDDIAVSLFGSCEGLFLDDMRKLVGLGVDPNKAFNAGWDCDVLHGCLQTYTRAEPDHFHACINTLIDGGAKFEDGPLWDLFRGRKTELQQTLAADPELAEKRFAYDFGQHLTLRGATLLHIAVEYNLRWAVELLLKCGADLNARVVVGTNGVGGQSPIFHAIGSNSGCCYELFEYLIALKPDLSVKAFVQDYQDDGQVRDGINKGKEYQVPSVREVTPLGYASWYEFEPTWRKAQREAKVLREIGPP